MVFSPPFHLILQVHLFASGMAQGATMDTIMVIHPYKLDGV
jgi:hypothetical protein